MILYIKQQIPNAIIKNDLLISPLPKIQVNYRILNNIEEINIYMVKFNKMSIIESIKNNKITLVLK
jgi:hypothetical protein